MTPRDRILAALNHQEADHIPYDLASTQVTGIHAVAYQKLRDALGLPPVEPRIYDSIQQLALPDDDVMQHLGVDTRGLFPLNSHNWNVVEEEGDGYFVYHDEWGITHHRPRPDGLYYSIVQVPLPDFGVTPEEIRGHNWPNMANPQRIAGLRELAQQHRAAGYAVVMKHPFAGLFEMSQRIVGMENALMFMALKPEVMQAVFEKLLELKLAIWEMALPELGDQLDIISYADDYGTQVSQLISPAMWREQIKPLLNTLFTRIKHLAPGVKLFFHSDGNIRPILPDFIELGVDILNPVQTTATGMEPVALKRDFGRELVFWGGGVDTQGILPNGTPQQVKDDVRRNLDALAPGGGYVFNTVHNIQADVPPQNIIAMWEALREYGVE
ncbi:MAG: uroporphyrinogen decarboxylase family protein [Anaerolineae bacterium]